MKKRFIPINNYSLGIECSKGWTIYDIVTKKDAWDWYIADTKKQVTEYIKHNNLNEIDPECVLENYFDINV